MGIQRDGEIEARLEVERVGLDLLFQRRRVARLAPLLGDFECGARRRHRRVVLLALGNELERRARRLQVASLDVAARKTGERRDAFRLGGEHLGVHFGGAGGVTLGEKSGGGLERFASLATSCLAAKAIDERLSLGCRKGPYESDRRLAVDEGEHSWDRLDVELARDRRMLK